MDAGYVDLLRDGLTLETEDGDEDASSGETGHELEETMFGIRRELSSNERTSNSSLSFPSHDTRLAESLAVFF